MLFAGLYDSVTLEGEHQPGKYIRFADGGWGGRRSVRITLDIHDRHDGGK
jgi:hypothetical protein